MPLATDYINLPVADRIELVKDIGDSIVEEEPVSVDLSAAQKAELDRRVAEHRANPNTAIPWEQVRAKLFSRQV
jgi:putative addiction module component (TIGR02574 family)